jgi:DNA-binding transcriptional regulator YbjK
LSPVDLPSRRDPEARRRAITDAAVTCIAEVGIGAVTHRQIARRAGVPLGSTTYYFPTLADLVEAALSQVAASSRVDIDAARAALQASDDPAVALRRFVEGYLEDRPRALVEYELYLAAARSDVLKPVARVWLDGLRATLGELTDAAFSRALAALIDGLLVQALVTGEPLDGDTLEASARALLHG